MADNNVNAVKTTCCPNPDFLDKANALGKTLLLESIGAISPTQAPIVYEEILHKDQRVCQSWIDQTPSRYVTSSGTAADFAADLAEAVGQSGNAACARDLASYLSSFPKVQK